MSRPLVTAERLRELLHYDPETGLFTWQVAHGRWGRIAPGAIAGVPDEKTGHIRIKIDNHRYRAHRLAWFYAYGRWPTGEIDHRNVDPSDNRLANLREATRVENARNRRRRSDNFSGFKGVTFNRGRWSARIQAGHKRICIGYFSRPEEAHAAYCEAAERLHGEFARTT